MRVQVVVTDDGKQSPSEQLQCTLTRCLVRLPVINGALLSGRELQMEDGINVERSRQAILAVVCQRCRVLMFLEAETVGKSKPAFAAYLTEALLAAAVSLGLRSLEVRYKVLGFEFSVNDAG